MIKLFSFLFKRSISEELKDLEKQVSNLGHMSGQRLKDLEERVSNLERASGRRRKYLDRLDKSLRAEVELGGH